MSDPLTRKHEIEPEPDQQAYDVCRNCRKPIQLDYLVPGTLVTIVGRNAECYGRPA